MTAPIADVRRHLLVTNDFPPKVGGIQSYLWELWRRLPGSSTTIMCTPHDGSVAFDVAQPMRIERSPEPFLVPYPWLSRRIDRLADAVGAELVLLDPAVPLGAVGPRLDTPYGVILHGAEVTIPARLPVSRTILARVLRGASLVVSAGNYALAEAERCAGMELPAVVIPPGVDTQRFVPLDPPRRAAARRRFGFAEDDVVIASVNRLVPRKGMDVLIDAVVELANRHPEVRLAIGGSGRQERELAERVRTTGARAELLGRLPDADVPLLYGAADVMAMLCHDRWRGLEQEGFGIVFLEAAGAGIPQIAGRSGGAAEAVEHDVTGLIVDDSRDVRAAVAAIEALVVDPERRRRMGDAARRRAVEEFDYDLLATRLAGSISRAKLRT